MGKFFVEGKLYEAATLQDARALAAASAQQTGGAATKAPVGPLPKTPVGSPAKSPVGPPPKTTGPAPVVGPSAVIAPTVVAPPKLVHQSTTATSAGTGEIKVVHRADGRFLTHESIKRDKGFACQNGQWCIREVACARAFIKKLIDPSFDSSKISGFEFAHEILTPAKNNFVLKGKKEIKQKDLNDVMVFIKRVLKDTRAFWVSTSLNKECGGYAGNMDYSLYKFTLPFALKQYELILGEPKNTLKAVDARTHNMVPTICFNGAALDGSDSTIVAINSGPVDDCEISFLTRIPLTWVETLRAKKA